MMNYLKYKGFVYETGKTGKETYRAYMEVVISFFLLLNTAIIFKGKPMATIIGNTEVQLRDEALIVVKYANKNEFFKLLQKKDYLRAPSAVALSNSRLIFSK